MLLRKKAKCLGITMMRIFFTCEYVSTTWAFTRATGTSNNFTAKTSFGKNKYGVHKLYSRVTCLNLNSNLFYVSILWYFSRWRWNNLGEASFGRRAIRVGCHRLTSCWDFFKDKLKSRHLLYNCSLQVDRASLWSIHVYNSLKKCGYNVPCKIMYNFLLVY